MNWKKILIGTFSLRRMINSLIIIYVLITVFAHFYADRLIFPYKHSSYDENLPGLQLIKSKSKIEIATRFWKAKNEKALILYFHGNYLDLGHLDDIAEALNNRGYSVLAMDYRGYGLSQGSASENNAYTDAQRVYDFALSKGYTEKTIIIFGRSIGTGVATELATKNKAIALVLISPLTSAYRVMTKYPIIAFDKFNNLSKINHIGMPLFIVHGNADEIIPSWHSQLLFEKYIGQKKRIVVKGARHNDIWEADDQFIQQLDGFIQHQIVIKL